MTTLKPSTSTKKQFNKVLSPSNINSKDNITSSTISQVLLRHIRSTSHSDKPAQSSSKKKTQLKRSNSNYNYKIPKATTSKISPKKGKIIGLEIHKVKKESSILSPKTTTTTQKKKLVNSNSVNVLKNHKSNTNSCNSTTGSSCVGNNNNHSLKKNVSHK